MASRGDLRAAGITVERPKDQKSLFRLGGSSVEKLVLIMKWIKLAVVLPALLLGALGDWTVTPACDDSSCEDACTVNDSCEPVITKYNGDCDDSTWDEMGVTLPAADDICTQCCDANCEAVKTFPNCTGDTCNQCYDSSSGIETTADYKLECCSDEEVTTCQFYATPDGWGDEWTSRVENQIPLVNAYSINELTVNGDNSDDSDCFDSVLSVTYQSGSCQLTEDITCKAWYHKEETADCERCLPQWDKTQFITSDFERKTIQCQAGTAAKCEKGSSTITDVQVVCS